MNRPIVVIGHRLGKGQEIAKGIEKAGGTPIVIEGVAADMKVGTVMKENDADLGISLCGSGGAGALTATNQFAYKSTHHLRSVDAGITAIKEGSQVLGFGFMDNEEMGEKLVAAWKEKNNG